MNFIKNLFKSKQQILFEQNVLKHQGYGIYCKNIFTRIHCFCLLNYNESINDLPFYLVAGSPDNDTFSLIDNQKRWYKNGKKHRDNDLPAIIDLGNNYSYYFRYGERHRENGPAIDKGDNSKNEWYLYGKEYDFIDWLKNHPNQDPSFQAKMKLQYS